MSATPEQQAALAAVHAAIQAALTAWPSADGSDDSDSIVVEWVVASSTERISGPRLDDDGDEVNEYFNLHSAGSANHASVGLLHQALNRLQR